MLLPEIDRELLRSLSVTSKGIISRGAVVARWHDPAPLACKTSVKVALDFARQHADEIASWQRGEADGTAQ
jgi:hypothetical protein